MSLDLGKLCSLLHTINEECQFRTLFPTVCCLLYAHVLGLYNLFLFLGKGLPSSTTAAQTQLAFSSGNASVVTASSNT